MYDISIKPFASITIYPDTISIYTQHKLLTGYFVLINYVKSLSMMISVQD